MGALFNAEQLLVDEAGGEDQYNTDHIIYVSPLKCHIATTEAAGRRCNIELFMWVYGGISCMLGNCSHAGWCYFFYLNDIPAHAMIWIIIRRW